MTLKNLLPRGTLGAQMVDLGMPQIVQNLKAHAWGDEVRTEPCFIYQQHIRILPYQEIATKGRDFRFLACLGDAISCAVCMVWVRAS